MFFFLYVWYDTPGRLHQTIVLSLCKTNIMIMSREDGIIMSFYFEAFPVAYQQCSGGGSLTN